MTMTCWFCGKPVNPALRETYRSISGWERPGKAGGSDIVLREPTGSYAHPTCIMLTRNGLNVRQETLV